MPIELDPFTRVYVKYPHSERKIREMLSRANKLTNLVEYETVKRGLRKCDVYHVYPERFDEQIQRVVMDGLVWLPILRSRSYSGFSHRHFPVNKLGPNTFVYGVVCRSLEDAKKFKEAHRERNTDHVTIGRLLGYPECDIKFFVTVWGNRILDPVYEIAVNTETSEVDINDVEGITKYTVRVTGHPYLNQLARYTSLRIATWFPHSYTCKDSIQVADKWFKLMKELDDETADWILDQLSQPMKWSLLYGVVEVDTPTLRIVAASYFTDHKKVVLWRT